MLPPRNGMQPQTELVRRPCFCLVKPIGKAVEFVTQFEVDNGQPTQPADKGSPFEDDPQSQPAPKTTPEAAPETDAQDESAPSDDSNDLIPDAPLPEAEDVPQQFTFG